MTYGFRPENWPAFGDIEKVEMRPEDAEGSAAATVVTVTLRSGRVDTWSQAADPR